MKMNARASSLLFYGTLGLCIVPALGGGIRLADLFFGGAIDSGNARFFDSPLPVVLHIVASLAFSVGGAVQFLYAPPGGERGRHRSAGRLLVVCGVVAAFSGLWMAAFYPPAKSYFDGPVLTVIRLIVGLAMLYALWRSVQAILWRDFAGHRNWMIRAYALGLGAGTQVFTHIPWFLLPDLQGEGLRTLCMGAGWGINLLVAEWLIRNVFASGTVATSRAR